MIFCICAVDLFDTSGEERAYDILYVADLYGLCVHVILRGLIVAWVQELAFSLLNVADDRLVS